MILENLNTSNMKSKIISHFGLWLIGFYCGLCAMYQRNFAQVSVRFPFLDFPIFIGEILLFVTFLFVIRKYLYIRFHLSKKYYFLIFYLVWLLVKSITSYAVDGPLALRNAALFYYPLFTLIGYHLYDRQFFNKKMIWIILSMLLLIKALVDINNYYVFPFYFLAFALLSTFDKKWLIALLIIPAIYLRRYHFQYPQDQLFPFIFFFQGGRARVLGHIVGILFLAFYIFFGHFRIPTRYKVLILSFVIFLLTIGLVRFADSSNIASLTKFNRIFASYNIYNNIIRDKEEQFNYVPLNTQLYSKEDVNLTGRVAWTIRTLDPIKGEKSLEMEDLLRGRADKIKEKRFSEMNSVLDKLKKQLKVDLEDAERKYRDQPEKLKEILAGIRKTARREFKRINQQARYAVTSELMEEINAMGMGGQFSTLQTFDLIQEKMESRDLSNAYNNILFRVFIWRDMFEEVLAKKVWWGVNFGYPQRSKSLEILGWASGEWRRDGWITPHNSYIHVVYRAGILGIFYLIMFFVAIFKLLYQIIRLKLIRGVFVVTILIYWMTIAMFSVFFELPYNAIPFWCLFGILMANIDDMKQFNQEMRT